MLGSCLRAGEGSATRQLVLLVHPFHFYRTAAMSLNRSDSPTRPQSRHVTVPVSDDASSRLSGVPWVRSSLPLVFRVRKFRGAIQRAGSGISSDLEFVGGIESSGRDRTELQNTSRTTGLSSSLSSPSRSRSSLSYTASRSLLRSLCFCTFRFVGRTKLSRALAQPSFRVMYPAVLGPQDWGASNDNWARARRSASWSDSSSRFLCSPYVRYVSSSPGYCTT
jgi:hypothetical protein